MNFKKLTLACLLSVAAGVGIVAVTPASADAAVWGCQNGFSAAGAYSYCSAGDVTYFHTNVICQNVITQVSYAKRGPSQRVGGQVPSVITGCGLLEAFAGDPWGSSG